MKKITTVIICLATATGMFFAGRGCGRAEGGGRSAGGEAGTTVTRIDTLIVRDTLRDTVLVPLTRHTVRVDTVWLQAAGDTLRVGDRPDSIRVALPFERRVYATDHYRAVVEGFRPTLVEMELYPERVHITSRTISIPNASRPVGRWGVGIQAGYGFSPKGAAPYVGIGIHYNLVNW